MSATKGAKSETQAEIDAGYADLETSYGTFLSGSELNVTPVMDRTFTCQALDTEVMGRGNTAEKKTVIRGLFRGRERSLVVNRRVRDALVQAQARGTPISRVVLVLAPIETTTPAGAPCLGITAHLPSAQSTI